MSSVNVINSLISEQSVARSRDSVRKFAFITVSCRRFTCSCLFNKREQANSPIVLLDSETYGKITQITSGFKYE